VRFLLAVLILLAFTCVAQAKKRPAIVEPLATIPPASVAYADSDYAPYLKEGDATISGQAFLKTRSGDVKIGAGNVVTLDPATPHARAVIPLRCEAVPRCEYYLTHIVRQLVLDENRCPQPPELDSLATQFHRTTVADASGRFSFDRLVPGSYFVSCRIVWETGEFTNGVNALDGYVLTGGQPYAIVSVAAGGHSNIVLTK
jgi:hypothetical protein